MQAMMQTMMEMQQQQQQQQQQQMFQQMKQQMQHPFYYVHPSLGINQQQIPVPVKQQVPVQQETTPQQSSLNCYSRCIWKQLSFW
jgi:hypothetical protein